MKQLILTIIMCLSVLISILGQNTQETAVNIGFKASSFSYTDTKNTTEYTNNYNGRSTNDVFYKFTLTRKMDVIISHCGSALTDTYLHLLNSSGIRIAYNDDYSGVGKCANSYHSRISMINLAEGTYYIVSEGYSLNGNITTTIQGIRPAEATSQNGGLDPSLDQNYSLTITPTVASADVTTLTVDQSLQTLQYFDGLGRPSQKVQRAISTGKKDLISLTEYDGAGRESRQWLPVPVADNQGAFLDTIYYKSTAYGSYNDSKPYSETRYELSPLNRITDQYGPGASWYSNEKRIITTYGANDGSVAYFYVNESGNLVRGSNYAAATLYKTTVADEDGKTVTEFKDKLDQVIMKRSASNVDTYYIYNDLGQLAFVLPPKAADGLMNYTLNTPILNDNDYLKKYAYLYKYDERGNCIEKRLPGCDPIYMVYDKADRLILSQDGNEHLKHQWTVNKYDIMGRLLYTGIVNREIADLEKQLIYNTVITESYMGGANTGFAGTGYTCTYFANEVSLLSAIYYDNYNFLEIWPDSITNDLVYQEKSSYGVAYAAYPIFGDEIGCKGLLTASITRILGTDNCLYQINYYDYKGQVVQSRSTNHLGGYNYVYNQYNFTGNLTKNLKVHSIPGQNPVTELYDYDYDHALRPTTTTYTLNNKPPVVLASNKYDEFGRLAEKKRHGSADKEEFEYNLRGWTTKIKSGTTFEENLYYNANIYNSIAEKCYNGNIAYSSWTYNGATKAYVYDYDDLNRLTEATAYQTNGYTLYSPNNKEKFEYDKQGNIERLWRDKDYSGIDFLQMTYTGNQITSITDAYASQGQYSVKEYQNKAGNTPNEMSYDANGNMVKDLDRNIFTIKYNLLNLPDTIQFANGNQIINQYDASGQKLYTRYYTVLYPEAVPVISTLEPGKTIKLEYNMDIVDETGVFYVNNYEYGFNGCDPGWYWIRRIHNPEGYFSQEPGTYQTFYYYRKDHIGNNREVWRSSYTNSYGDLTVPADTEQKTQYYPSGLPWKSNSGDNPGSQPYKYGGKEFVEMHGLDEYDSDARWYYPAIMRTTTPDPLAEKYYDISPYAWCLNNPIRFTDPTGREVDLSQMSEEERKRYESQIAVQRQNSELFNTMYTYLESSKDVYVVQFGQTTSEGTEPVKGQFTPNSEGGGTVTFLANQESINSTVLSEEFFHAYQHDNRGNYGSREFNKEFEAKVFSSSVGSEFGGFGFIDGMSDYQLNVRNGVYGDGQQIISPKTVVSASFVKEYISSANSYSKHNRENNIGNSHYKRNTSVAPYSLQKVVIDTYKKK